MNPPRRLVGRALALNDLITKKQALKTRVEAPALTASANSRRDYLAGRVRAALIAAAKTDPIRDFSSCQCEFHCDGAEVGDTLVASVIWRPTVKLPRGVDPTNFVLFNSQRRDALLAAVNPPFPKAPRTGPSTATTQTGITTGDRRFLEYVKIWAEYFAPLNLALVTVAVEQYTAAVARSDQSANLHFDTSLQAAARPTNTLSPATKTYLRRQVTNRIFRANDAASFDSLTARRTLDAISAAIYGSGADAGWFTDLMTDEAIKQLGSDLDEYLLLEEDDRGNFIRSRRFTGSSTAKLNSAISQVYEGQEGAVDRYLNEVGKEIARSNPAVLNRFFSPLPAETMKSIQDSVRDTYQNMVDGLLQDIDGYLLEGADSETAIRRALGQKPINIKEGDFKAKRRAREFDNRYPGADDTFSPWLANVQEDLSVYNANIALHEFAGAEVGRGRQIEEMWQARFVNTRDTHAEAHGQVVGINETFEVGGYAADFPHDPSLPPRERYNCRCSVVLVETDSQQQQRLLDIGADPKI